MKKLLLLTVLTFSLAAQAQKSFYKGAIVADVRYGIEVYNTTLKSTSMKASITIVTAQKVLISHLL